MKKLIILMFLVSSLIPGHAAIDRFDRADTTAQTSSSSPNQIGSQWTIASGAWAISNHQLIQANQQNSSEQIIYFNTLGTTNSVSGSGFTIQATVQLNTANGQNSGVWVGLLFNYQSPGNFYALRFTDSGSLQLIKETGGNAAAALSVNGAFTFVQNRPYTLTVTSTNAGRFCVGVYDTVTSETAYTNASVVAGGSSFSNGFGGLYANAGYGVEACDNFSLNGVTQPLIQSKLLAQLTDGLIVINWNGQGTLETADQVSGPWTAIANATNPYTNAIPTGSQFFRLNQTIVPPSYSLYVATNGNDITGTGSISSPFATLDRARQAVATANYEMSSDIVVHVRGGTYYQNATVRYGWSDSGFNGHNIIYQAYTNETPVLSGGAPITSWTSLSNGLYTANVGTNRFRQLYVNGRRAIRARTPNAASFARITSWNTSTKTITVGSSDVANIGNLGAVEMVIARNFNQDRLRVTSATVNGNTATLAFQNPESTQSFAYDFPARLPNQAYFLENSLSFLDSPDEWHLDTTTETLYYMPLAAEPITNSIIIIPRIDTLITLQGDSLAFPIHNIKLAGLTFAHTVWNAVDSVGYVGNQAGTARIGGEMSSGVFADRADSLTFANNTFAHMGGQALTLHSACHTNIIAGNIVTDISGNGISVDRALVQNPADPRMTSSYNSISNNYIYDCAVDYWGSVGIFGGFVANTYIGFNEVAWLPYTGISVGWGWTLADNPARTNSIEWNHVHHVMNLLEDGAAIYTLSKQPGTQINHNYLHDIRRSSWSRSSAIAAIYLDQGSSQISVSNNVILPVELRVNQNVTVSPPATNNFIGGNDSLLSSVVDNAGPSAAGRPSPIGPTLVGYWKMENASGTTADSSGHGNSGTIYGSTDITNGLCGNALQFNGGTYILVPDSSTLRVQQFTICAWVRPATALSEMNYPILVGKQDDAAKTGYLLGNLLAASNSFAARILNGTTNLDGSYSEPSYTNWIHIAGIYDGASLRIYRNGKLASEMGFTNTTTIAHDTTPLIIGTNFVGAIDEVRIYNAALSEADLQTLVDMKMDSSIVARWPMDDGNAYFFLSDLSGNENFGNLTFQYSYTTTPATIQWVTNLSNSKNWSSKSNQSYLSFLAGGNPGISVYDSASLRLTNYTISAWVYPADSFSAMGSAYPALVSKMNFPIGYYLGCPDSHGNTLANRILTGTTFFDSSYSETSHTNWIHVVGTYDGNANRIYRNGVLQSSVVTGSQTIQNDSVGLLLGQGFEGSMRDVRIYNRALSLTEIQLLEP